MSESSDRIPVSSETFEELGHLRDAEQTWDDLLRELADREKKRRLRRRMDEIEESEEFVPLDEAQA